MQYQLLLGQDFNKCCNFKSSYRIANDWNYSMIDTYNAIVKCYVSSRYLFVIYWFIHVIEHNFVKCIWLVEICFSPQQNQRVGSFSDSE